MEFTDAKVKTAVAAMIEFQEVLERDFPDIKSRIKALEETFEPIKGVDLKAVTTELDRVKAQHDQLAGLVRNHKRGLYVPGIEDVGHFSLLKTCLAVKRGGRKSTFEEMGAGLEWEVLKNVWDRHGGSMEFAENKTQVIGDDQLGGMFVPDQVIAQPIEALYARSVFMALDGEGDTRVTTLDGLTGGKVSIPKMIGGLIAYWTAEAEKSTESVAKSGTVELSPNKLSILAKVTEEMRKFSSPAFDRMFERDFSRSAALAADLAIAYGKGGKEPLGIANTPGIIVYSAQSKNAGVLGTDDLAGTTLFQDDWAGAALDFDGIEEMACEIEDRDIPLEGPGVATIGHRRAFKELRQLKVDNFSGQSGNKPYLLGAPMLSDSKLTELIGPFGHSTQIASKNKPGASVGAPTTSSDLKSGDVFHGDLSQVVVGRWGGVEVTSDQGLGTGFTAGEEQVRLVTYMDVQMRHAAAMALCPDAKVRA